MSTWSSIAFFLAVAVNLIVALFYPYMDGQFNAIGRWVRSVVAMVIGGWVGADNVLGGWSLLSGDALGVSEVSSPLSLPIGIMLGWVHPC